MSTTQHRVIVTLCLCACAAWALAQTTTTPAAPAIPYTLSECLALALDHQSDVLVGARNLDASQARSTQARSAYYPQLSVEATERIAKSGGVDRDGVSLAVTQTFYDGGLREARVARAKYDVAQTDASLERTRQTVVFSVTQSYLAQLRAKQLAAVADRRVAYIEGQRNLVKGRVEAGDAAEVDILPLEAQLANAQVDRLAAKNAVRTAAIQLQQAMGLTAAMDFDITDVTARPDMPLPTVDECLQQAIAQRPEVRQNTAAVQSAKSSVKTAKINMGPRPVITGELGQPITGGDSMTYAISGGIVFDLFTGGNNRAVYQEAQANLSSAEIRAAQAAKTITADVHEAYLNVLNARERTDASALSVTAAERNFSVQEARYAQGLAIPLDLLNAQLEVTTAQSNAVQAQYDYLTALAQLHYAMGKQGEVIWE